MYEKLARGHATAYINSLQDYGRFLDWMEGPRSMKVVDVLERSSLSKKPGRILTGPKSGIEAWRRNLKLNGPMRRGTR